MSLAGGGKDWKVAGLRCTHKMSLTKKPTKPMTMKPRPVRSAILENSRRSGLVHRFTSRYESFANSLTGLNAKSATSILLSFLVSKRINARRGESRDDRGKIAAGGAGYSRRGGRTNGGSSGARAL